MSLKKKLALGLGAVVVGLGVWLGPALFDLKDYVATAVTPQQMREYEASNQDNLKAIYTALKLHEESEGVFPEGADWMDAIENRIRASDMTEEEAAKKLRDPMRSKGPDEYGYALNDAAAGQYHEDIPNPSTTPLVFLATDMKRNAHGDPETLGADPGERAFGISIDGTILKK